MNFSFLSLILMLISTTATTPKWGYEKDIGPDDWGKLDPAYSPCGEGLEQSPVDIPSSAPLHPANIEFNYQPGKLHIENNGRTIITYVEAGSFITLDNIRYTLKQFHFHALSEHTIANNHTDLELHFVHEDDTGKNAVIAVFLKRGQENPALAPIWENMPPTPGKDYIIDDDSINLEDLLPTDRAYYRYKGSLTTPPCTEGVIWLVMPKPIELSDKQAKAFETLYPHNYRPLQALNDRCFL